MMTATEIINWRIIALYIGSRHTRQRPGLYIAQVDIALGAFKIIDIGGCFSIEFGAFWRLRQQIGNLSTEGYV